MGKREAWLHESALPTLCWIFLTRAASPNVVVHENSPGFPKDTLSSLFAQFVCSPINLNPCRMGFPYHRARRYTICANRKTLASPFALFNLLSLDGHHDIVCFKREVDCDVYLCAPQDRVLD